MTTPKLNFFTKSEVRINGVEGRSAFNIFFIVNNNDICHHDN
jgi:hypothetical protein